ncbi:MAG: hypothetical protein VB026_05305 [Anaerolineaceae bacterium]|nr:hypothetical protein [Anaerolineaceae bacterium]
MKKYFFSIFCLFFLLVLTGCEQNLSLNFYSEENWKLKAEADFDAGVIHDLGSAAGDLFGDAFDTNIPDSLFNPEIYLDPIMTFVSKSARNYGVNFDWRYDRKKLKYSMSGESYRLFQETGIITDLGDGTYRLLINYNDSFSNFGSEFNSIMNQANTYFVDNIVEISAGEIIESNADKVNGSKATWYNPEEIYLVYRPGSSAIYLKIFLWVFGIALAILILILIIKSAKQKTCPSCGNRVKASVLECPNCGTYLGN